MRTSIPAATTTRRPPRRPRARFDGIAASVLLLFIAPLAYGIEPSPGEMAEAHRWARAKFQGVQEQQQKEPGLEVLENHGPVQANARGDEPLKIGAKVYQRGLYCHAPSRVTVRLPRPGKTFTAEIGVDSRAGGGSIVFIVGVGGREAFRSEVLRLDRAAVPITVDLAWAKEFTLEVTDAGDGISSDQADWADAGVLLDDGTRLWLGDMPILSGARAAYTIDPPFSFTYGGRPSSELLANWMTERTTSAKGGASSEHVLTCTDPATGLAVRCAAVEYLDGPAVEWTLYLENTGSAPTPLIEDLQAVDTLLGAGRQGDCMLRHITGDLCTQDSYAPRQESMPAGSTKRIASTGGRPTESAFPYFNLVWPGEGVIVVLGWPGQWAARFTCGGGVRVRAGQELTRFRLHPGEEVRSPRIVLLFYRGDWLRGQNLWRRWMVAHNMPRPGGRPVRPMASLCTGNYYPGLMSNTIQELDFLKQHIDAGVRFDTWWQDAGWYPCDGVGWVKTGTWEVDRKRYPKGLREISDFVHANGRRTILWFEPERVHRDTWLSENHPEWVFGGKGGGLLKLGDPACRQWITDTIDRLIAGQGIDVYRQDFNFSPLDSWRAADAEDRQGITEIRHVEGYLAFWDELLRRHPGLLIDSCASGGRRNDIETLRRSVPLLRSDWYHGADGQQCLTYGLSLWLPYQGTGAVYGRHNDPYWIRSSMVAGFSFGPDAAGMAAADLVLQKRMVDEFHGIADCFLGDFYPLTPYTLADDCWMAWQHDLPESGRGVVRAFRRGGCIYEAASIPLRGLDPEAEYAIEELDTGETVKAMGRGLTADGLRVTIRSRPGSAVLVYQRGAPR